MSLPGGQAPAAHAQIPLESPRLSLGTRLRDAGVRAKVPDSDHAWMGGWQHRPPIGGGPRVCFAGFSSIMENSSSSVLMSCVWALITLGVTEPDFIGMT